jgi:ribosomal protein S18 acetylase RimI-like enzyme
MAQEAIIREATCADVPAIARVHVDTWRTTYPGIMPDEFLANLSYERSEQRWAASLCVEDSPTFVYVAEQDGKVVGFSSAGPVAHGNVQGFDGELYTIYLLKDQQQSGLGRQLVRAVAQRFAEEGKTSMMLWMAAENTPARRFYEKLGGIPVQTQVTEFSGVPINEIAYGWQDISGLLNL